MTFEKISKEIQAKKFAAVYYFTGVEPYYIDKLDKMIEHNALNPGEEAFNKAVFYGPETTFEKIMGELRSFPMMAQRRLVILREAQKFKDFDKLESYFKNPVSSTVFSIIWKGKGIDGRSKVAKTLKENAEVFETKAIYEKECREIAQNCIKAAGFRIQDEALYTLISFLGNNPTLIESELEKVFINLRGSGKTLIDTNLVYDIINIDKDFNIFELQNALGERDHGRAQLIISKMTRNLKEYPPVLTISGLFSYYNKLALASSKGTSDDKELASLLGVHPFFVKDYKNALRRNSPNQIYKGLAALLEADLQLKGVITTHMGEEHILKTLIYRLLN